MKATGQPGFAKARNSRPGELSVERPLVLSDATVNDTDAHRYAERADSWWNEQGPFWPLHRLNHLRLHYLASCYSSPQSVAKEKPLSGIECLDIGCGGGLLAEGMSKLGARVTGIDVVERNIEVARHHSLTAGLSLDYQLTTAGALADEGRQYDLVLNMEVVEHVDNFPRYMAQCCRLVRPGGDMVVATINRTVASFLTAIVGAEYVLKWLPRGTHRWREFRRPTEVAACLGAGGLNCYDQRGVRVNPITREFSLIDSTSINYMVRARKNGPPH